MARPKRTQKTETVRMTVYMNQLVKDRIDGLVSLTGSNGVPEMLRKAMAIYEMIVDNHINGGQVILRSQNGNDREIVIY